MPYVNWIQALQIINKQNDCLESSCTWDCELVLFFTGVFPGSTRLLSSKEWLYIAWMWLAIIICKKYTKDKISVLVRRTKEKRNKHRQMVYEKTHGLEYRQFISLPSTPQPLPSPFLDYSSAFSMPIQISYFGNDKWKMLHKNCLLCRLGNQW